MSSFLIDLPGARVANLVLTPLAVGAVLAAAGTRRERRGKSRSALEYFGAGVALSLGIAAVRLAFAAG